MMREDRTVVDIPLAFKFDASLVKHEYFHGLLPREDTASLLTKDGDFLLRLSEADTLGARLETILPVLHDPKSCVAVGDDPETRAPYVLYTKSTKKVRRRPVGFASWEFHAENIELEDVIGVFGVGEVRKGKVFRKDDAPLTVAVKTLNGPLNVYLNRHKEKIKQNEYLLMVSNIACGPEYLHENSILHRDLAAKNCLYNKQFVKLSGFSMSKKESVYTMKTTRRLAVKWLPPETIESFQYTQKSDVYGCGIIIYEIFAVKEPYDRFTNDEAKSFILNGDVNDFPGTTPKMLAEMVRNKMWALDKDKRPTMREVMMWMQDYTGMELKIIKTCDVTSSDMIFLSDCYGYRSSEDRFVCVKGRSVDGFARFPRTTAEITTEKEEEGLGLGKRAMLRRKGDGSGATVFNWL